ncbi:sulfate adenylyltransferase [Mumia flava]|uniref:Adenylyl-sulfate kinase n=1 Tax=Mumia flava TaxID=1348852 RepID=A0A2M9BGQ2_9ACTN|nr:adenylyl-sulfate kinase [Mumia flava]PJJ57128.1 sulfate adenylyltransferase [Mumia flava]
MTDQQWTPGARGLADLELVMLDAWPTDRPLELDLPADLSGPVELLDPEGLPLAVHDRSDGSTTVLTTPQYGPFRRYHLSPAQVRDAVPNGFAVLVDRPLTTDDVASITAEETRSGRQVVLLVTTGPDPRRTVTAPALVRATLAALPGRATVAVALAARDDETDDAALRRAVAARYADEVIDLPGTGSLDDAVAAIVDADVPPLDERGLVVFFTGLSGSGKSTLARALYDRVLEEGRRTVTSLDGDVVRHHLSKGLGFSKEDRETNIARIGWVAAEIARHHGLAICSPIAPFDSTRKQVRAMAEGAGATFALVHVATPLEECERRDRKGLYAKARAGQIPEFTGISSPYEVPDDALVAVDTTGRTIEDALTDVVDALIDAGVWRTA